MAKKVTPKSQRQISNDSINTYHVDGMMSGELNNPNNNVIQENNRASQLSFKDDIKKSQTVSLTNIDESLFYYFNEVLKPTVYQDGRKIQVPVMYSNPELWVGSQKNGYYRDKSGAIMCPIITFKRNNITKNRLTNKIDANNPFNYWLYKQKYSNKNAYDKFDILNNRVQQYQYGITVVPDYVTIDYSCIIMTYYIEQLNNIIEAINYASDSYWGDPNRFKFNCRIDSFATTVEYGDSNRRLVKSTFDIKLNGYIVPDVEIKDINSINKVNSVTNIKISENTINKL